MPANPFGPGCPWHALHMSYPPNVDWCEAKLCSLVVTPFNSWSNIAYLIAAALMWRQAGKVGGPVLRMFPLAAALTGAASFVYHVSLNSFSQMVDFFGMYVFCMLILMANMQRAGKWASGARGPRHYWAAVFGLTAISAVALLQQLPAQIAVGVLVMLIVLSELRLPARSRRYFWMGVAAMVFASTLSALDLTRVMCAADNHWFQAHGAWHIVTALALYLAFLHTDNALYSQDLARSAAPGVPAATA